MDRNEIEYYEKLSTSVKMLGIDMISKANSGHPGIVLGASSILTLLWINFLNINPNNPNWFNRDRFVLSAGHGSALLYSLMYHSGYNIDINDLKRFRQLNSKTPGHPEAEYTEGVDATTGPLGQGLAMGVGMALCEKKMACSYNKQNYNIIDHYTYVLCGDGDLMEGISTEAASFAGVYKLNKLIVLYDSNNINLDGNTSDCFTENIIEKFKSLNWNTIYVDDGYDFEKINKAILEAKASDKPTLIEFKTIIGKDSIYENSNISHGKPLSSKDVQLLREKLTWNYKEFEIPEKIKKIFYLLVNKRGEKENKIWNKLIFDYKEKYPELYEELKISLNKNIGKIDWHTYKDGFKQAIRNSSYDCIQKIFENVPYLLGGSADLSSSTMTKIKETNYIKCDNMFGNNIQYGVREFSMAAIANGISLHGGFLPFVSTFLVFSDYLKASLRLSAMMKQQVIYVFTHDSICVGEDGPTHQPIEQLSNLRSIPNLYVFRPADSRETISSWHTALHIKNAPSAIVLSRQELTVTKYSNSFKALKGGYIYYEEKLPLKVILIATGSEVELALNIVKKLEKENIGVRLISMPCIEIFELQNSSYKNHVLPNDDTLRVFIEMANPQSWYKYLSRNDLIFGIEKFGKSGKSEEVRKEYGFSIDNISTKILNKLKNEEKN